MTTASNSLGGSDADNRNPGRLSRVWSHRPQLLRLGFFVGAYILGCAFAHSLAIGPETGISIWPPAGLFVATLIATPGYSWPWWVFAAFLAELVSNILWFRNPLPVTFLFSAGNALEAVVGAWLVTRTCKRPVSLETLQVVLAFVALAAGIAPALSATVGSATLMWFGMKPHSFAAAWPLRWVGNATGILIVAPLVLAAFQNWRGEARFSVARGLEACVVAVILLGAAALSLGGYLPFAYIIMPPLLWAAVRFEYKGAAVSLALLALITAAFTLSGDSPFAGAPETQPHRQIMLQLFLAISAFSALVVAAISRQHHQSLLTLRRSQQQLQQMIDTLPVRIWSATPDGVPMYFNKRYQDHFNDVLPSFTPREVPSIHDLVGHLIHPDDASDVQRTLRGCLESASAAVMRFRWLDKDGAYRWTECRVEPRRDESGAVAEWYGVSIDIDDQTRLYGDVQERDARIRRLVESDIIGIVIWDLDGSLIDANDAFLRMVRYDRADLQAGLRWFDMTPPEWQEVHARYEAEELARTGKMQAREKEFFRKDGSRVPVLIWAACFEGKSTQGVGYILDLTERKRAEAALLDRERELAQLVDMLPVYIRRLSPEGEPIFFNKRLTDFIGVRLADIGAAGTGRLRPAVENFVHPDDAAKVVAAIRNAIATGEDYAMRYRMHGADGVYRWIETRAEPLRNQDGTIAQWYSVSVDIEDQVRALQAEEALRRASDELAKATQVASLSELSASIAHEVNQPLAAVVANSHACQRWLMAKPPNLERAQMTVERIIRDANAAADVVSRIRALFKQSVETRTSTAFGSVIEEARKLIAEEAARRRIRVELDVESSLPLVALDRIQIQQVLVNLMRNGIEATDAVADERSLGVRARRLGDSIQVEVSDHGPGIESSDRIFEPFFTTKEQGMGMGLAICRSIIESHGGRLWAEANEPRGARFIFTLPVETKVAS